MSGFISKRLSANARVPEEYTRNVFGCLSAPIMLHNPSQSEDGIMKPKLETEDREALQRVFRSLKVFKLLNDRMPLQYVLSFMAVAIDEGKSVSEYAKVLGVNNTTMSRHLLDIGPFNRNHEEGYGLIDYRADPLERRRHQYFLTSKGKQYVDMILTEVYS